MFSSGGSRRRHRKRKTCRRGGNLAGVASQAAVPFGLFALSNYLGTGKKKSKRKGTRKGMRRKTARRAYMK